MGGRRLRYGPRFKSGAVSAGYKYDKFVHETSVPPHAFRQWMKKPGNAEKIAFKAHSTMRNRKRGITLAGQETKPEVDERFEVEKRIVDRLRTMMGMIEMSIAELANAPPYKYKSQSDSALVNQHGFIDAMDKLSKCARPPLQVPRLGNTMKPITANRIVHPCVSCGGPGVFERKREWYCEDCLPPGGH